MSSVAKRLSAVAITVASVFATGCGESANTRAASYGAKDLASGADVSVASLRGSPALLVSWTTWCVECDEELAGLQAFAESSAADGIQIVAVNLDASDATEEINAKIAKHALTTMLWRDKRNEFKKVFGTLGVPTTVLLDAQGAVAGIFPGAVDFGEQRILDALEQVRGT